MESSWLNRDVAFAQKELVLKELENPMSNPPFVAFRWAMTRVSPHDFDTFLDIGCGVGHYGLLLRQWYPNLVYYGEDFSEHMIEVARDMCPSGYFGVKRLEDSAPGDYDIAMVSGVLEYTPDPPQALKGVLEKSNVLIVHRARITDRPGFVVEPTYCGNHEPKYLWHEGEVESVIGDRRFDSLEWGWGHKTFVVWS